jgi:hypothetical protein
MEETRLLASSILHSYSHRSLYLGALMEKLIDSDPEDYSMEALLFKMALHTDQNPTHGFDCACKDTYTRQFKNILRNNPRIAREFRLVAAYISRDNSIPS